MSATTTTSPNAQVKIKASKEPVSWGATSVLILCAFTVILPLFVAISMAFKTSAQAVDGQAFTLPSPFSISGFVEAWNLTNFPVGAGISFVVTAGTVFCTILLSAMASYAIVRNWDRKLFKYSFFYLMAVMFIPFSVVALPQIQLTGILHLDNYFGVIFLAMMFQMAFSVMLCRSSVRGIFRASQYWVPAAPAGRPARRRPGTAPSAPRHRPIPAA